MPLKLIEAANIVLPFQAALCIINRKHSTPIYLCDSYSGKSEKQAVQRYVRSTYLINPVYNAFLSGMQSGVYRMRDLAPDQWDSDPEQSHADMSPDTSEEIGFLTVGWPARLEELVLVSRISEDVMVEISFAQPITLGGFSAESIAKFDAFFPLFSVAMEAVGNHALQTQPNLNRLEVQLEKFASQQLTQRENQVIQLILKGHSGKSICTNLGISLPTLKSHRKNAYAKLSVANQQELFRKFMLWKHALDLT